jgi:hypothetical protein
MTLTGPEREMGAGSQTLHIPCGGVLVGRSRGICAPHSTSVAPPHTAPVPVDVRRSPSVGPHSRGRSYH